MNSKAESLGLNSTKFSNVTGLDPKNAGSGVNSSTVSDLASSHNSMRKSLSTS